MKINCIHKLKTSQENKNCHWCKKYKINIDKSGRICNRCMNDYWFKINLNRLINKNKKTISNNHCVHRGKLIHEKPCKCASGRIWECDILGQVVERLCRKDKCNKYEAKEGT
jgi:hypothetical protein